MINPQAGCGITPSHYPVDRLRVRGRHLEDSYGHVILPEGLSIVGGPEQSNYLAARSATEAQIDAAPAWHANSQRLQISQSNLVGHPTPGYAYNRPFARYLNQLICRILAEHEIPILNDNTWFTGGQRAPTAATLRFWDYMSRNYGRWPVIFDLFNEPRLKHDAAGTFLGDARIWQLWKWGGTVSGAHYVGMQQLVDEIRQRDRADNVIWIESAYETSHTAELPGHLIAGSDLMYSFHKLPLVNPATWYAVGRLQSRGLALVDGEWSEYAALHRPWECYPGAYTSAPAYLAYWLSLGVGIEAWSLQRGVLVKGSPGVVAQDGNFLGLATNPRELETPNAMTPSYGCDRQSLGQGAGTLILNYFRDDSRPPPAALFRR